jgi:hypothetical protein
MGRLIFTPAMDSQLSRLYPDLANKKIAEMTGWDVEALWRRSVKLGLKKTRECKAKTANATEWNDDMITYLQQNFFIQTNRQLADHLQVGLTVMRNKAAELGLRRIEVDPWTPQQQVFLEEHYKCMGDVEIAENLQKLYPRKTLWTKKHVCKKRRLLNLNRSAEEIKLIIMNHMQPGGRCHTILRNSSSKNLSDSFIAQLIAWRDKDLQKEVLKYPGLIELKRNEVLLNRAIKEVNHGA